MTTKKVTAYRKYILENENKYPASVSEKDRKKKLREDWNALTTEEKQVYASSTSSQKTPGRKRKSNAAASAVFDIYFEENKKMISAKYYVANENDIRSVALHLWSAMEQDDRDTFHKTHAIPDLDNTIKKQLPSMKTRILALGEDGHGVWDLLETDFETSVKSYLENNTPISIRVASKNIEKKYELADKYLSRFKDLFKPLITNMALRLQHLYEDKKKEQTTNVEPEPEPELDQNLSDILGEEDNNGNANSQDEPEDDILEDAIVDIYSSSS